MTPGKPQSFQGSSASQIEYQAPPVEILEAVMLSISGYDMKTLGAPEYVQDSAQGFVDALERWIEELKHPKPKVSVVMVPNANVQALDPVEDAVASLSMVAEVPSESHDA